MTKDYGCPKEWKWGQQLTQIDVPELREREVVFHRKVTRDDLSLTVGDCIEVVNFQTDRTGQSDIGKIKHIFRVTKDSWTSDRARAIVQWYSRIEGIPSHCLTSDTVVEETEREVFKDDRFNGDISLGTIFGKCTILEIPEEMSMSSLLSATPSLRESDFFICRYKLVRKSERKFKLIPILNNELSEKKSQTPTCKVQKETPKTNPHIRRSFRERSRTVSPIRIVGKCVVTRSSSIHRPPMDDIAEIESSDAENESPNKRRNSEDDLSMTPRKRTLINSRSVRRNLNESLNNSELNDSAASDQLNYSIVEGGADTLKVKLRKSENQKQKVPSSPRKRFPEKELTTSPRKTRRGSVKTPAMSSREERISRRSIALSENVERPLRSRRHTVGFYTDLLADSPNTTPETPRSTRMTKISSRPKSVGKKHIPEIELKSSPRKTLRKSILKTPTLQLISVEKTPKRSITLSDVIEEIPVGKPLRSCTKRQTIGFYTDPPVDSPEEVKSQTPRSARAAKTPSTPKAAGKIPGQMTPSQKMKMLREGVITPTLSSRQHEVKGRKSQLELVRDHLHVSAVPKSLPCRENEFKDIRQFLEGRIRDGSGGCMYISGVPGTGKTATVTEVIRTLQNSCHKLKLPKFEYIEINGMRLTEPRQAYVHIYRQLQGRTVPWEQAYNFLDKLFRTGNGKKSKTTVLVVDELDMLCNRRQDVVYNLLDWPANRTAHLVVVTIANTMDLPERLLKGKVTSRLGLTRLTFKPYSFRQLQEIVTSRLAGFDAFNGDALQLVARKVAAVSGDARRALDICRRAVEIAEQTHTKGEREMVLMSHVEKALNEMIANPKVQAIRACSRMEQIFLQAIIAESLRTGIEETIFLGVYAQFETLSSISGLSTPPVSSTLEICARLGAFRLIISQHSRTDIYQKIMLNISPDDVHYALQEKHI
ncbi:Origin recognition complex subunit 1 [Sergentomyia squamirostris]